jgi:bifunctional DNA-binding transcriptional regulator/antitoxin component of YhaV-PrlF toxin-antitoxin module
MRVTSNGQVTIPQFVREAMGIRVSETEVEFVQDASGRWFLRKLGARVKIYLHFRAAPLICEVILTRSLKSERGKISRSRTAHKAGKLRRSTDEILKLTRGK